MAEVCFGGVTGGPKKNTIVWERVVRYQRFKGGFVLCSVVVCCHTGGWGGV